MKEGAKPGQVLAAIIESIMPGGLFPEGERRQRRLKEEYDRAWTELKAGDEDALTPFFAAHPEYEARLALWAEPEERLRKFLINSVWDRWFALARPNRRKVTQVLGTEFEDFLSDETRDEEHIDVQPLAMWAQALGAQTPQVQELEGMPTAEIQYYPEEMVSAVEEYMRERNQLFPNYYALQTEYFNLPAGYQRRSFLQRFPQLKQYWQWKDEYRQQHPEIVPYLEDVSQEYRLEEARNAMDSALMEDLLGTMVGESMSKGGDAEMRRLYNIYGSRMGLTLEEFLTVMGGGL